MIGAISPDLMPLCSPVLNSSSVNGSPEKNFSISSSEVSAIASFKESLSSKVTTETPNFSFNWSTTFPVSTFSLSILLKRKNLGISNSLHVFHAFSVPT